MSLVVVVALWAAAATPSPIAVMPWKDLSGSPELAWLSQGMQETMTSDLKRAGVNVVERGRIAGVLREQQVGDDEVAGAVVVGRLVGAKTLVLGSFQKAGNELRLNARFVDVETGEIRKASKATGGVNRVFALQDQIVQALVPTKKPPPPPSTPAQLLAYQRFAEGLDVVDDEARAKALRESLKLAPDFSYAVDALALLSAKVDRALDASARVVLERSKPMLDVAFGAGPVELRGPALLQLLALLERGRCYEALLAASERALSSSSSLTAQAETASAARVTALVRLRRLDDALQAGEKHVVAFAGGASVDAVAALVREVIDERRSLPKRRAEFDEELADNTNGDEAARDFRPCIAAKWSLLPDEMTKRCEAFLRRYERSGYADDKQNVRSARAYVAWAAALRGEFAEAWRLANELEHDDAGALDEIGLREVMESRWSRDRR